MIRRTHIEILPGGGGERKSTYDGSIKTPVKGKRTG